MRMFDHWEHPRFPHNARPPVTRVTTLTGTDTRPRYAAAPVNTLPAQAHNRGGGLSWRPVA